MTALPVPRSAFVFAAPVTGVDYTPPVTGERTLAALRETRRVQRLMRDLAAGRWRELLLRVSQHQFPVVESAAGKLSQLLVKLNLVGVAMEEHAETLAGERSNVAAAEGYDAQHEAAVGIARRVLWDQRLLMAAEIVNIEGSCALRYGVESTAGGRGVVITVEDNEVCFPVGRLGADMQPTAWERRWVVEIDDPADRRRKIKVLRVESHWLPEGSPVAAVAQRAYVVESADPLATAVGEKGARPFDLALIPSEDGGPVDPLTLLPGPGLDIVQLVIGRRPVGGSGGAPPKLRISPEDLDLIDALTASLSRLVRSLELHAEPRMVVPENAIDKRTGRLPKGQRVFVDTDGRRPEFILLDAKFGEMLDVVERFVDYLLLGLRSTRVILGLPSRGGGGAPSTLGELRMNAQPLLSAARSAATYLTPALERVWTGATEMQSRLPGGGFDCAPMNVRLHPGLFMTFDDVVASQAAALQAGLTSEWRAVAAVHGAEAADVVLEEIRGDRERRADLAARSLMADMATPVTPARTGGGGDPSRGDAAEGGGE